MQLAVILWQGHACVGESWDTNIQGGPHGMCRLTLSTIYDMGRELRYSITFVLQEG